MGAAPSVEVITVQFCMGEKDGVSALVMSSHSEINNLILKNKQVTIKMDANDVFFLKLWWRRATSKHAKPDKE